jgi:hypothetical protein
MGASLDALDPDLRQGYNELIQVCHLAGLTTTLTSTVRTIREQTYLYKRYLAGASSLPAAPPGHSAHEYGWAFDMVVSPTQWQGNVGRAWETTWGGTWGGEKDPVHFELPGASKLAWTLGEQGAQPIQPGRPQPGDVWYQLADFMSGLLPGVGELQLVDSLVSALDGNADLAAWYLHHPAEGTRDLLAKIKSWF